MDERRKSRRYPAAYPVEKRKGEANLALTMVDVSRGGLAFTDNAALKENETVDHQALKENVTDALKASVDFFYGAYGLSDSIDCIPGGNRVGGLGRLEDDAFFGPID